MKPEDYPAQEPLSELAQPYHDEVMRRGEGITGIETQIGADPYQSVMVFPADRPSGEVLIMIHGGGWTNGYKEWMTFKAPTMNAAGITFVTVGYRLAPMHTFPAGLEDCQRAVAWVYANIAATHADPGRIFVAGHSAGGHYASLMAARRDWQSSHGLPETVIRGCLPISGVYRFGEDSGMSMRPRFLGDDVNDDDASPIAKISASPPPFFLAYGSADFPHLIAQAKAMAAALERASGEVCTIELPGRDHLGASYACGEPDGPWAARAIEWMQTH